MQAEDRAAAELRVGELMRKEQFGSVTLYQGDCLEVMKSIPGGSVDLVLTDPPYGTTACKWDSVIPMAPMWEQLKRIIKPNGAIVMTASQPFTSALVMSNPKMFKWADVWHKCRATGHLNAKIMPLREHEDVLVFGLGRVLYNPQIKPKKPENIRPDGRGSTTKCYGKFSVSSCRGIPSNMTYPRSVVMVNNTNRGESGLHPTQKPVALMEYLIRTYTDEGEIVLDFTMGSGTTGVACLNTGRSFIGIELDQQYFDAAFKRIDLATKQECLSL